MSRDLFIAAATHANDSGQTCYGAGTSIVCRELMDLTGAHFPEAHLDLNGIGFDSDEARGMRGGEHAHVSSTGRARGRAKDFADLRALD